MRIALNRLDTLKEELEGIEETEEEMKLISEHVLAPESILRESDILDRRIRRHQEGWAWLAS